MRRCRVKTLREITAEIRDNNVAHGWRRAEGGPGDNTWGDYVALLHTEVAEMTEAYRDYGLADATEERRGISLHGLGRSDPEAPLPKPEGVGSELADVFIRTLDMADVFGLVLFDMDLEIGDISPIPLHDFGFVSFGDHTAWLHDCVTALRRLPQGNLPGLLRALVAVAEHYGFDLNAEYERKIAYNKTRPYQHGGRTMAKTDGAA